MVYQSRWHRNVIFFILLSTFLSPVAVHAGICAKNYLELKKTKRLMTLEPILPSSGKKGFVNQTKGSFLYIESNKNVFSISFYTTGLFDLSGIVRSGKVIFCDTGKNIIIIGVGRTKNIFPKGKGIKFGRGGPRESFEPGSMPEALQKAHGFSVLK